MKSGEDIESYLIRMQMPYEDTGKGIWIVRGAPGVDALVISMAGSIIVFRVKVLEINDIPKGDRESLYKLLLELNSSEVVHGAYAIEGDNIILTEALQIENLDFNEFQASFDDLTMAVANHSPRLAPFRKAA